MRYSYDSDLSTEKKIAATVISSKKMAEIFIKRYMDRHHVNRSEALVKLKQWGIQLSSLPEQI